MTTFTHLKRTRFSTNRRKSYVAFLLFSAIFLILLFLRLSDIAFAAQLATPLRQLLGNTAVAQLETWLFDAQDSAQRLTYDMGLAQPAAPWQMETVILPSATPTATSLPPTPSTTGLPQPFASLILPAMNDLAMTALPVIPILSPTPTLLPTQTPTPAPPPWQPAPLEPLGSLVGEGVWSVYMTHPMTGRAIAYRTFLQPDPERSFTVVAIVAFDLSAVQLNYVLGSEEPALPDGPHGDGRIPLGHKRPGHLLAAFNGGFMATHGQYGAMAAGVEVLPPQDGLATVALGADGRIQIGSWGEEIQPTADWLAWRQNAHLVVSGGEMTAETNANSLFYWSGSIDNEVVTWRSGLGLSADGRMLTYFAGPSLNMPALGRAMVAAGVEQGMLLDINPYWVHFSAIRSEDTQMVAEPLLADMQHKPDRFLRPYARDFFYITLVNPVPEAVMAQ